MMYDYFNRQLSQQPPRRITVTELQHVVVMRRGTSRLLANGRHRLSQRNDRLWIESATPQVIVVPSQEVLTADGVTVRATVSAVLTISDPLRAMRAGDWRQRIHLDLQLALRREVTALELESLVASRSQLDEPLLEVARTSASEIGIEVEKVALRDFVVPGDQRKLLASIVAARLEGQASLERARGETAALRSLSNAAALVRDNPALYRLRLLQEIGASEGNTFVIDTGPPSPGT